MKLKISYLILFTLIVNIFFANATIRFVSKTGTSTPPYTSWETAADSIQKCINICVDGDTVYVANGIYKENLTINTQIFLSGMSMDSTLIDGTGLVDKTLNFVSEGKIENFNIYGKGTTGACIWANEFIEIKNCRLSNTGIGVVIFRRSSIVNNIIMKDLTRGYDAGCSSGSCINILTNCVMFLDRENSMGALISIGGDYNINNNIILYTGSIFNNPRNGISIGAPRKVHINNNLISGFTNNIFTDDPFDTVIIKNNVLLNQYSNGPDPASINSSNDNLFVNNVILSKNKNAINGDLIVTSDYNLFWKNQINLQGVVSGDSDFVSDPMFVNDTIPTENGNYNFHLQKYSPAIDKGNPDVLDLDGTRSDIGLYGGPFGETYTYQDLAPLAPRNLSAVVDTNQILLKWNKNTEADTSYYKVYRDTVISFKIDSTKLVSSSTDTFFIQLPPYNSSKYVYKVICIDNQGNESKPSQELLVNITSVSMDDFPLTISDYVLYQNYPNPFNPSTKIGYQLKQRAQVRLMIYDLKGELISVLVNKEQNAGYYEVEFSSSSIKNPVSSIQNLASGIYLYRIEVIGEGNIPVYTEMKKMLMIK